MEKSLIVVKHELKIDFATHEAAKYACENWHYSKCIPVGKLVKIGAWENGKFIGVVIFGRGANKDVGKPYDCDQTECAELVRIALKNHLTPVSKIMMIAVKFLKKTNENIKLIVSFADQEQGHYGGIYQATNWIYTGTTTPAEEYFYNGKRYHGRAFRKQHGSHKNYLNKGLKIIMGSSKHRYLMPLNDNIKQKLMLLSKPYPKRGTKAISSDQLESGGAIPTATLQSLGEPNGSHT